MKNQNAHEFRRTYHWFHALLACVASLASACTSDIEIAAEDLMVEGGCPEWACGTNTAVINNSMIETLNLSDDDGDVYDDSDGRLRIVAVEHETGLPLDLQVQNGEFIGTDLTGARYRGNALIGTRIIFRDLDDLSLHAITIDGFSSITSWTQPVFQVPAYYLSAAQLDANLVPLSTRALCNSSESTPDPSQYVVLIKGELYDALSKTVLDGSYYGDEQWFNLACKDSALAKMKLLGYDPEFTNTAATRQTTPAERQATLKMITADYCGTGTSFTAIGEPLIWYNRSNTVVPGSVVAASSEAIWSANGAICLDVARRADSEPDIATRIAAECGAPLPSCTSFLQSWTQYGEWHTANPN